MAYEFRFPDIGEGITEGEILAWRVKEGDTIAQDETIAEIETDKAVVELPSPKAGRIASLRGSEGDIVNVGDVVAVIEESGAAGDGAAPAAQQAEPRVAVPETAAPAAGAVTSAPAAAATPPQPAPAAAEEVAYTGSVVGRLEEAPEEEAPPLAAAPPRPAEAGPAREEPVGEAERGGAVLAMPSVRALAKELGVDLTTIRGTGPGGRILKQDVQDVAERTAYGRAAPGAGAAVPQPAAAPGAAVQPAAAAGRPPAAEAPTEAVTQAPTVPAEVGGPVPVMGGVLGDDGIGLVERVPFHGIRRTMAKRMAESVAKQAQVTVSDEADATILRRIREKERTVAAERGVRLTYLAFTVKACTAALQRFPRLNALLEESREEFVLKRYYNIGIAIDTKSGLVVPNIKNADRKSIFEIAREIVDLGERADQRRLDLQEVKGGTFTITNYGAIGGLYATPVINYPEVAILGMGRVREVPVVRDGKVGTRLALPLSLTFDHQLIDGAEATRFLNLVIGYLEDPDLLLLEGA